MCLQDDMLALAIHLTVTAALLLAVSAIVRGVKVGGWGSAFFGAIVLGLVNALVRPAIVFLTLPLTVITFGLFLFVVNALVLWIVATLSPGVRVQGFMAALIGSFMLTLLNFGIELLFGPNLTVI